MKKENRIRQKKKAQQQWLDENYDKLKEYALERGSSIATLDAAIQEVFEEDIREITTGKRSNNRWDR